MTKSDFKVIGLMSGTSLDGLDIAYCHFSNPHGQWHFNIEKAITVDYPHEIEEKIKMAASLNTIDFLHLHNKLGKFYGKAVNEFINQNELVVDFISSHGHTIFHQPEKRLNFQMGNPQVIRQITGLPVVADFRTGNILAGGQGAPLVPIGDKLLFGEYDYCVNLGGFSNISYDDKNSQRIAFDICPVNIILNRLAQQTGSSFDTNGKTGKKGKVFPPLLNALNALDYYRKPAPKSLGAEWFGNEFLPVVESYNIPLIDKLRTIYEHIAVQFQNLLNLLPQGKILLTGGGTHNTFLTGLFQQRLKQEIVIPPNTVIDYKEALIFAFLGVLWKENIPNCLASYTGAPGDMVCGIWYE